ncbi:MAG: YncE family protein [Nitrososphaerales archaeon]|jgi:DNA-binding beta-propeller fold protein YncE
MPRSNPVWVVSILIACLVGSVALLPVAGAATGSASTALSSVSLGTVPRGVAVNTNSGVIYTSLFLNGTTLALSPVTFTVFGRVETPSPYAVAVDSVTGLAYVSQGERASIVVLDSSGNTVLASITGAGTPYAMVVDEPQNLLFAADTSANSLWIVNCSSDAVISRLPMGDTSALAFDSVNHEAFIGNVSSGYDAGSVSVVSSDSMKIIRTISIPVAPMSFAVDPVSHLLFVTGTGPNATSPNFLAINDETFQMVYELHLGDSPQLMAAASSPDVYVSDPGVNRLYEVDGASGKVVLNSTGDPSIGIGFAAITSMAFSPLTGTLYLTENDVTSLIVLSATTATSTPSPTLDAPVWYLIALILIGASLLVALFLVRRRERRRRRPAAGRTDGLPTASSGPPGWTPPRPASHHRPLRPTGGSSRASRALV